MPWRTSVKGQRGALRPRDRHRRSRLQCRFRQRCRVGRDDRRSGWRYRDIRRHPEQPRHSRSGRDRGPVRRGPDHQPPDRLRTAPWMWRSACRTRTSARLADAGSVIILRDLYDPVEDADSAIDQNSAGVPGVAEAGDQFGRSLDSVNVIFEFVQLAGHRRTRGGHRVAGAMPVRSSSSARMRWTLSPRAGSVPGHVRRDTVAESGDLFGDRLAFGVARPCGEAASGWRSSAPNEDGRRRITGLVQVFPVTDLDAEVSYAQNSPGDPRGGPAATDSAASLAIVVGGSGASGDRRRARRRRPRPTAWSTSSPSGVARRDTGRRGSTGVPGPGSSRFGAALGSVHGST